MSERREVRAGRWVMIDKGKVADHPVYGGLAANRWKVDSVKNGRARIGNVTLPVAILRAVRVKEAKAVAR